MILSRRRSLVSGVLAVGASLVSSCGFGSATHDPTPRAEVPRPGISPAAAAQASSPNQPRASTPLPAQITSSDPVLTAKLDSFIKQQQVQYDFSGVVLAAQGTGVLIRQSYGPTNRELNVPNIPESKFTIGSITKQFTAMLTMMLAEGGNLGIDDPITKYIPTSPSNWSAITIRNLLNHTSGFAASVDTGRPGDVEPSTVYQVIDRLKTTPLEFPPGSTFAYRNNDYVILGSIIEQVSGQDFATFLNQRILQPLGMTNSGVWPASVVLEGRAAGYEMLLGKFINVPTLDFAGKYIFAAGGLISTADDLYRWDQALDTEKLVSKKTLDTIFTPGKGGYGFGWFIEDDGGHRRIWHDGTLAGFDCVIGRYPEDHVTTIVLSNVQDSSVDPNYYARALFRIIEGKDPYSL